MCIEDGRIRKIVGDKEHPLSEGFICPKGVAAVDFHYHPDRLNYPLKRIGEKGYGKWKRITWEQALDEIGEKLEEIRQKYGPEAIATTRGTLRTDHHFMSRFFNLVSSPNYFGPATICFGNTAAIHTATYGGFVLPHSAGGEDTKCIVIWGKNPAQSYFRIWININKLKRAGTKIITIDPRFTESAKIADVWLQIRPGTDSALALAWLNVIINERLYDKDFVEKYTVGFDELVRRVKQYTPEKVSEITWIPADRIRYSAIMYATNKPARLLWGVKPDQLGNNSTHTIRAQCILRALTGNLDIKGGELLGISNEVGKAISDTELELNEKLPPEQRHIQLGADRFKISSWPGFELMSKYVDGCPYQDSESANVVALGHQPTLWRAILTEKPYPVKALIIQSNNPLLQATNTKLVYKALKILDLLVVMDYFMTPTAMLADYVLPAADWLERPTMTSLAGVRNYVNVGERAVHPEYERRTDYHLWKELGIRLGQEKYWPWKTLEEVCNHRLKPLGYNLEDFVKNIRVLIGPTKYKKYEIHGFATPSKKVELRSSVFEKFGYDPLPHYEEPAESSISTPELAKDYPLILITGGRVKYFTHSEFRQIEPLRKRHPDPITQINPKTARRLGISDGDWIWIETPLGKIKQKAKLDPGIRPEVINSEHGWWFPEMPAEEPTLHGLWSSNVNVLIDDDPGKCDPMCGGWPHYTLCRVSKAKI